MFQHSNRDEQQTPEGSEATEARC